MTKLKLIVLPLAIAFVFIAEMINSALQQAIDVDDVDLLEAREGHCGRRGRSDCNAVAHRLPGFSERDAVWLLDGARRTRPGDVIASS